jgi:hypothetical protein
MKDRRGRKETEAKINAKAWKDPEFRKKLIANPRQALKEMGMQNIPAQLKIDVMKEEKDHWCIVLREPPAGYGSLSEEELEKLAAAADSEECGGGSCLTGY